MRKSINKYKKEFLVSLEEYRGYSELTVKTYADVLGEAFQYIEIVQEDGHTVFNLMPYRIYIAGLNAKTISKKLSAIRSFVEFLNEQGLHVALQADESIKVAKTLPKPVSHAHILEALSQSDLQEKLLAVMLYTLGLRISELASLELHNITNEWIRVIGKGNKQRDIPLLGTTRALIDEYLSTFVVKKFLFEKNGERLSENSLRYMITKIFKRVALKVTPHQLRHSYASSLLNGGAPIVDVSELLGHSSMATTQIYTKLGSALKQQNYNKAHPLGDSEC
ncbi:tyrosine-type recombinase/integrase [Sulfurimonas autotrophica]|uniref:Integrase family protein n=1 Tax=Sulfurimonas autotrophica (strain ATCC BAA-671 / DSM 16294 / JCM 11897 / OK10) TaxID=563040 RepID=E0UPK0_SULAO|nr:tyrosine-type recombinase/integrase [Sulfurimonas autotrophica]ADN08592.1 integrase family protein [Sulfurimonas autotrophica DSM 16294]